MKRSIFKIASIACIIVVALIAGVVFCQMAESPQEPQPKKDHIVAPPAPAEESGPLENVVKLSTPGDERETAIADRLKSQPTPSTRAIYFRSILENPDFRLKRWHLTILEVKTVDGVTRVKVRAIPLVTSRFAAVTHVDGLLDETYEVNEDGLKLLKTDPLVDPAVVKEFSIIGC